MNAASLKTRRRWLSCWLLGAALVIAGNIWLVRHVAVLREHSPWPYLKQAEQLKQQGNWVAAIAMLKEAADRDAASAIPWEQIGLIHYGQRQWMEALQAFQGALKRGSRSVEVRGQAVWCLIHLKKFSEAVAFGKACIDENIYSPQFYNFIAEACRRANDYQQAIPYLEQALKETPNDLYLLELLMQCHTQLKHTEKAAEIQRRIDTLQGQKTNAGNSTVANPKS